MKHLRVYLSFVRFSHSVFALPFALAGALLAARAHPITWTRVAWILVAMVAARHYQSTVLLASSVRGFEPPPRLRAVRRVCHLGAEASVAQVRPVTNFAIADTH